MRARRPHRAADDRAVLAFVVRRPACSLAGRAGVLGGGLARGFYSALSYHGLGRGTVTPRSVARQALPRYQSAFSVVATSSTRRATMHGTVKSVIFETKIVLDLKLVYKKC